jgi:hypothetical protein
VISSAHTQVSNFRLLLARYLWKRFGKHPVLYSISCCCISCKAATCKIGNLDLSLRIMPFFWNQNFLPKMLSFSSSSSSSSSLLFSSPSVFFLCFFGGGC